MTDLDAGDRLVGGVIRARAARQGRAALGIGGAALVLSVPPWVLPWLPAIGFGLCMLLPMVLGAVAVAAGATMLPMVDLEPAPPVLPETVGGPVDLTPR